MRLWFLIVLALLLTGCGDVLYDSAYTLQPEYVLVAAGIDQQQYIQSINQSLATTSNPWAKADTHLMLARLQQSNASYTQACVSYADFSPKNTEEQALLYETLASLNCSGKQERYLNKASKQWEKMGVTWRANILNNLAKRNLSFNTTPISSRLNLSSAEQIILGNTTITITPQDKVSTQVDRVYRDWLGRQLFQDPFQGEYLVTFSERLTYNETALRADIGWHEGGRARDLYEYVGVHAQPVTGTLVAFHNGTWYAPDDKGIFQFEVPLDKVSYPTTRFLTPTLAMIIDTHGVNMLVEQTLRLQNTVVLSDCDHPGKVKAAVYLSQHNVSVICFPDRFVFHALGHDAKLVGSPTWHYDKTKKEMVYGGSPVVLQRNQPIVVMNAHIGKTYAVWYYTTPWFYFSKLNETFPLQLIEVSVDDFDQTANVYDTARTEGAKVVAGRIFTQHDHDMAAQWLAEDDEHTLILFHSTMYPYGILLMQAFPEQVSFDDPNIIALS